MDISSLDDQCSGFRYDSFNVSVYLYYLLGTLRSGLGLRLGLRLGSGLGLGVRLGLGLGLGLGCYIVFRY